MKEKAFNLTVTGGVCVRVGKKEREGENDVIILKLKQKKNFQTK